MGWELFAGLLNGLGQLAYFIVALFTASYILTRLGLLSSLSTGAARENARLEAESILQQAELQAKEEAIRRREAVEAEIEAMRQEHREQERRLEKRSESLEQLQEQLVRREIELETAQKRATVQSELYEAKRGELDRQIREATDSLLRSAGMTADEARELVLERVERELGEAIAARQRREEDALRAESQERAREILATAIQRHAAGFTSESTVCSVELPTDDLKGRVIGREGRNIRAFEKASGVDVVVDDSPGVVLLSGFDPIRREVARRAMLELIKDGRIHPARIEDALERSKGEIGGVIRQAGEDALAELRLSAMHEQLLEYLGKLKFRTSYAQNVLRHSVEVAWLAGMIAEELGLDGALARRCGLLHDVGKAAEHEMPGPHTEVGAQLARRYGEPEEVIHAAQGHHDDLRVDRPYTVIVAAADAISASRPGARNDNLDRYTRRLENLESIATAFPEVEQAYAIQAGRELRVIVDSRATSDHRAITLCLEIARAIERQGALPGEIKVTVIRETRTVNFARPKGAS